MESRHGTAHRRRPARGSAILFLAAIALAATLRPAADGLIWLAGRGSAAMAVSGLALLIAFRLLRNRQAG
ncbi:hypothetical protein [Sphingomonas sp.]|uniref:hypothetical protein n=1 Tax=Sphingomonas sp. TaxID=28214 RepID=UPI000DB22D15|nr:hypothetical protein [Sphingomonas sp.]PZU11832.1 MAG: hypothetical protein DI605_02405 [Sphingomonas sp.]